MVKRKRISLSVRLQPYSGTLMAEVASWLNSLERDEAKRMVEAALVMAYLPYARASGDADAKEIERCCWETQDLLDKHGYNLRQTLQVSQPGWQHHEPPRTEKASTKDELVDSRSSTVESETEISFPESRIKGIGHHRDLDALFGDD